ncbi:hypothetical protein WICANDRAFT_81087 [Wickerhamomyces anomalus NRRL Y-366-8]|uniref:Calcineurin-like phosphoesterase domain-containing protein n=1 Tax=Wickerhamomyces anomalus (strain ATCC 58044 / CBS 1984 / NCYC 433 / NRRL Y-366-8) TaxID=683960 RepID=A0A1E3NX54_WICAA|nr:uncharacterized protein WICANDRAFT_81087 [Wickerhamomyces anomalus NRRL Y-366-8]ODQ57761.1 hypothetical protein WICANDRAFT_81087 [Wickerhamomyces anomalus NRRL Y-366-8]
MKVSSMLLGTLAALSTVVNAVPLFNLELTLDTTVFTPSDAKLIVDFARQLTLIDQFNGTNTTKCDKCIKRLQLGKTITMTKPNLVYPVFTKWCIDNKVANKVTCETNYGRNTVDNSTFGTNFANMLYLMDPSSYDGQLYCHFQDTKSCPLPKTPKVDLSGYWPPKQPKHHVAPTPGNETYNVLHVSDFHIELNYQIGAEANCSRGMCCTPYSKNAAKLPQGYSFTANLTEDQIGNLSYTPAWYDEDNELQYGEPVDVFKNGSDVWYPANTFGHYECDAPPVLVNSSLNSVAKFQEELDLDFKFSIFTGDLVEHDEAQYKSHEFVIESEEIVFRDMKKTLKGIPVFSVLGNHDTFPYAQLAQEKSGFGNLFDWNADLMADMWEDYGWINSTTAQHVRKHYSGFAVTTSTDLKIIVLNSNAYYVKNLYMYWNATDIDSFGQFQFLIDELVDAEAKDQRVWIMAHIPFIKEALPLPAEVFTQIIKRFSPYTIAGIFFGHTHLDQFNLLYDGGVGNKTEQNLVANAWISQALTPLTENNPGWRYYSIDTKTHSVMNSFNYYTKLNDTFTNGNEEPIWEFEYSAREAYESVAEWPDNAPLNATFWHRVATGVNNTEEIAQTYSNYKKRFSPFTPNCIGTDECDGSWCFLSSFTAKDHQECMKMYGQPDIY